MEGSDFRGADILQDGVEVRLAVRRYGDEAAPPTVGDANRPNAYVTLEASFSDSDDESRESRGVKVPCRGILRE